MSTIIRKLNKGKGKEKELLDDLLNQLQTEQDESDTTEVAEPIAITDQVKDDKIE